LAQGRVAGRVAEQGNEMAMMQQGQTAMLQQNAQNFGNVNAGIHAIENQERFTQGQMQQSANMMQGQIGNMQNGFQDIQGQMKQFHDSDAQVGEIMRMDSQVMQNRYNEAANLDRQNNENDILYAQAQGKLTTQRVGESTKRALDNNRKFEARAFGRQDSLVRRHFTRMNGEKRRENKANVMRNLARRERALQRSLARKQEEIAHQLHIRKQLEKAKIARRKLRGLQRVNTDRIIRFMRNQSKRLRKQTRAQERRRDVRERHRQQEALSRRSEMRLQREISEKNRSQQLKSLMNGLLARQSRFLNDVSKNMRFWTKKQHSVHKQHTEAFKRLDRTLNARLRRLQDELQDE